MVQSRFSWLDSGHVWIWLVEAPVRRVDLMGDSSIIRVRGRLRKVIDQTMKRYLEVNSLSLNFVHNWALTHWLIHLAELNSANGKKLGYWFFILIHHIWSFGLPCTFYFEQMLMVLLQLTVIVTTWLNFQWSAWASNIILWCHTSWKENFTETRDWENGAVFYWSAQSTGP